jgi:glycosyltransferase involved in cell wall biosynthesis
MPPLISILIPAYNAQRWIGSTIESALAQSWPRKEIIVVDDGSTDGTLATARRFASSEVTVIAQTNQGAAAARNNAYSLCQGDYVQWLDADDLLSPDKISRQMEVAGGPRILLSSAWGTFIHRVRKATFVSTPLWCDLKPVEWICRKLEGNFSMQTATWLVSRELTEAAGPWDTRLLGDDDGEYFCRVVAAATGIRFVSEARMYYRRGFSSLSYIGYSDRKLEAQLLSMKLTMSCLRSLEDSVRVRQACLNFLETWLPVFYPERPDLMREMKELAASLGGYLIAPRVPWKYAWIKTAFGWRAAKRTQIRYNEIKAFVISSWDELMFHMEGRTASPGGHLARGIR